jgi:hypothetical protein
MRRTLFAFIVLVFALSSSLAGQVIPRPALSSRRGPHNRRMFI